MTVRAGDIDQQKRNVGSGTVRGVHRVFQWIGEWRIGDVPFFRTGVIAVQFQPDARWVFAPGTVVFDQDLAAVVDATVKNGGHQLEEHWILRCRADQAGAQGVGAAHLAPAAGDGVKGSIFLAGQWHHLVVVAAGHLFIDEAERRPQGLEQFKQDP